MDFVFMTLRFHVVISVIRVCRWSLIGSLEITLIPFSVVFGAVLCEHLELVLLGLFEFF